MHVCCTRSGVAGRHLGRLRELHADVVDAGGIWPVQVKGDSYAPATFEARRTSRPSDTSRRILRNDGDSLKRGRDINDADNRDRQFVAVVSESFVKRYWPNEDPISHHSRSPSPTAKSSASSATCLPRPGASE
jgi:hypothetical protein